MELLAVTSEVPVDPAAGIIVSTRDYWERQN